MVAFTLNNWNETRIDKMRENQLLKKPVQNLNSNINPFNNNIDTETQFLRSIDCALDHMDNLKPGQHSLSWHCQRM